MAKVYTKKGDQGETCLVDGEKVSKSHTRLESYGTLDELNSHIGVLRSHWTQHNESATFLKILDPLFFQIQNDLFNLGSQLANNNEALKAQLPNITPKDVVKLEAKIDELTEHLTPLQNFILPGGSFLSSYLHVARTVCRRAERIIIRLKEESKEDSSVEPLCIQYVNRLSDLFFVAARYANSIESIADVEWKK